MSGGDAIRAAGPEVSGKLAPNQVGGGCEVHEETAHSL